MATEKSSSVNVEGAFRAGFDFGRVGWRFLLKFCLLLAFCHLLLGTFKEAAHLLEFTSRGGLKTFFDGQLTREIIIWLSQIEPIKFLFGVLICAPLFASLYAMVIRKYAHGTENGFWGLALGRAEWIYMAIYLAIQIGIYIVTLPILLAFHFGHDITIFFQLVFILNIVLIWVYIPISTRLYYTAIGVIIAPEMNIKTLWKKSKDNGRNLFFLEVGASIAIGIILFLITVACAIIFRIRLSGFESLIKAGFSITFIFSSYKLTIVPILAAIFETIRLSFLTSLRVNAFKQLLEINQ